MLKKNSPPSLEEPLLVETNWVTLWQAIGNDWSWMLRQESLSSPHASKTMRNNSLKRHSILIEIFLTVSLLLLAKYIESSQKFMRYQQEDSNFFGGGTVQFDNSSRNGSLF